MRSWISFAVGAVLAFAALYGAEYIGFNKGLDKAPKGPNWYTADCFVLGASSVSLVDSKNPASIRILNHAKQTCGLKGS